MIGHLSERLFTLPDGTSLSVTAGIGAAQYEQGKTCIDFLARADNALYEAKRAGRNRLHVAPPRRVAMAV